jgi:hypothetical protein
MSFTFRSVLKIAVLILTAQVFANGAEPKLIGVRKIWDAAPHNAFTDLVRFQGRWYCVFREGMAHVSPDGALRVLTSEDGEKWSSAALLKSGDSDLRDAKLVVTPDQRLMLSGAGALHQPHQHKHRSLTWFSSDGRAWSDPIQIGDPNMWLWRTTWHKDRAYSIGYDTGGEKLIRLYSSADGKKFDVLVPTLYDQGFPNESSLLFLPDDSGLCLLRRDGPQANSLLGITKPPYKEKDWTWKDLGMRVGGPHMIQLPDGRIVAAGRLYEPSARTALMWLDGQGGKLTEFLKLPSGGDTSYPGLVWHEGILWVSYYSSHEGKTSIYLAKVSL